MDVSGSDGVGLVGRSVVVAGAAVELGDLVGQGCEVRSVVCKVGCEGGDVVGSVGWHVAAFNCCLDEMFCGV